ncbi:MAG: hypothetical protein ACK4F9_02400 [Brevinematia bacterium]
MKKIFIYILSTIISLSISMHAFSETIEEIEKILINHNEKGYSFIKKLGQGSWKVSLEYQGGSKEVYVYVSPNKNNPDFDIVYIYTGIKVYNDSDLNSALDDLIFALQRNSAPSEWGTFSLYKEGNKWYLDYNVKIRRKYANETHLMNAIGWVVGGASVYEKQF